MATLIHPDGRTEARTAKGKKFTLEELQAAVGGYIEILDRWVPRQTGLHDETNSTGTGRGKARVRIVINEEGKIHGLARNRWATALIVDGLMNGDYIAGPALVFGKGESL